jgi:hypothetical protein
MRLSWFILRIRETGGTAKGFSRAKAHSMTIASPQSPLTTHVDVQLKVRNRDLESMTVGRGPAGTEAVLTCELVAELQAPALNVAAG